MYASWGGLDPYNVMWSHTKTNRDRVNENKDLIRGSLHQHCLASIMRSGSIFTKSDGCSAIRRSFVDGGF